MRARYVSRKEMGAEPEEAHIGMEVQAQFVRNSKFKVTDVYFVPAG